MRLSKSKREELRLQFNGGCAFCGSALPDRGWHAENIGEEYVAGGLVAICSECWSSKGKASPDAFRAMLAVQVEKAQRHSVNFRTALRFGLVSQSNSPVKFWFERCESTHASKPAPALTTARNNAGIM